MFVGKIVKSVYCLKKKKKEENVVRKGRETAAEF